VRGTEWATGPIILATLGAATFAHYAFADHAAPRLLRRDWRNTILTDLQLWAAFVGAAMAGLSLMAAGVVHVAVGQTQINDVRDRNQRAAATGNHRIGESLRDVRVRQHGKEVRHRKAAERDAVHYRIGVSKRAQKQHQDRVDDEKAENRQQERNPQASPCALTLTGATHDLAAPTHLFVQRVPLAGDRLFIDLRSRCAKA